MKVAILYDSKYGNTKKIAEYLADKVNSSGHEVRLFRTGESKPENLLNFIPEVILVGGPTHMGRPARALGKYLKKMGKLIKKGSSVNIKKSGVFNCYNNNIVCHKIKNNVADIFTDVEIYENSLPIKVGGMKGPLPSNWEDDAAAFIAEFLGFIK